MNNGEVRQSLVKEVVIAVKERCEDVEAETLKVISIGNPHKEAENDNQIFLDIHGDKVSFGVPQKAMHGFVSQLRAKLPKKGFIEITGLDASGNRRVYCLIVDLALQWQILQQVGACLGPQVYSTAIEGIKIK
jgi:predicted aconitase